MAMVDVKTILRWRMFEPCTHGDWRCAECAVETVDPDGKRAHCGCECHALLIDEISLDEQWFDDEPASIRISSLSGANDEKL